MKKISAILMLILISIAAYSICRFTDNGDGTVKDNASGLIWQKCSMGMTYSSGSCNDTATEGTWKVSLAYCAGLTLAGKSWRLPNYNELRSILDTSKYNPAIHKGIFPKTVSSQYWTSSTHYASYGSAHMIDFTAGEMSYGGKAAENYVRCVTGP